jgi:hypothetical protein
MKTNLHVGVALLLAATPASPACAEESAWGVSLGLFSPQGEASREIYTTPSTPLRKE